MINRILPILGLKNISSEDIIKKGLEKVTPKFKSFFEQAGKYGYPLGATLGFLQSEFSGAGKKPDQTMRPDEQANMELNRQSQLPGRIANTLGKTALGGAVGGVGGAAISSLGSSLGQGKDQNQKEAPQQEGSPGPGGFLNFIKQHPELGSFLDQAIQKGLSPRDASMKAKGMRKFKDVILDIESNVGQKFEDLLEQLFQAPNQQQTQQQGSPSQGQQMSGDSALIAALDKILKM